jgi:hypothetical protein
MSTVLGANSCIRDMRTDELFDGETGDEEIV